MDKRTLKIGCDRCGAAFRVDMREELREKIAGAVDRGSMDCTPPVLVANEILDVVFPQPPELLCSGCDQSKEASPNDQ